MSRRLTLFVRSRISITKKLLIMGIYDYIKTWDQIILEWFDGRIHNSQIGYERLIDINWKL
jgi:hypothetical protein